MFLKYLLISLFGVIVLIIIGIRLITKKTKSLNKHTTLMEEKNKQMVGLKEYLSPQIDVLIVEMENGIAAGSATTVPTDTNQQIQEDWDSESSNQQITWP
ncbi:hypothetical protein A4C56_02755 [Elizabethkingia anophelis]|uniref:hypothetical protein n=1 Tax=Elizabethkingia anophelis TaxID=1117645 RepID=UPI00077EBC08|nr:hypothetical protein [Elizabethkingia anophelis]AMR40349.1 hypothetical protein A2T74_02755 [Elizabethkingia anophelis]AMX46981.1 hypothetical protein A4C56_02755 [Elizabethkingia anophelis]AMX50444.1 hypothetical protein A2T72_02755 [Elizabethkingia anophelis]AMX53833.1 hypothetical protein A2T59_02755 [Elizabethkingia anophelis]